MAEFSSGPEPSTALGTSSADGHIHSRSPRLPQAQAENILASLAGRSTSPTGADPVGLHAGGPKVKSHATAGAVAKPAHEESAPAGPALADDPNGNDILPAKPRSRFRFRLR